MASSTLGAVTVGLRLPYNAMYKVPGVRKVTSEVAAGGLSVDALGYLIGTSDEPFPVPEDFAQSEGEGLSQELHSLPDEASPFEVSPDANVLHAEVTAVPLGSHPKPKRFMPPAEWPGQVWRVLNKFQAQQDAVEWEYRMSKWTERLDSKEKKICIGEHIASPQ